MKFAPLIGTSILTVLLAAVAPAAAADYKLTLHSQTETAPGSGKFQPVDKPEKWSPRETAIIVCDVWDLHHSQNAVRRLEEFVPRLNEVLIKAREAGATIIHAPSDCMPAYAGHPARLRATQTPKTAKVPPEMDLWRSYLRTEENGIYPIDQSDGGDDDDPTEHAAWAAKLKALGRNPGLPWQKQTDMIQIDGDRDYLSDRGIEVWNILQDRNIKQVILTGVHTNMCVLGRPFGLRQMVSAKMPVVLMRDMTDTMYNPRIWPYVSHYRGTELVLDHVERYVCPTITSDQILGGQPFRFKHADDAATSSANAAATVAATKRDYFDHWSLIKVPGSLAEGSQQRLADYSGPGYFRCVIRGSISWLHQPVQLSLEAPQEGVQAWLNGVPLQRAGNAAFALPPAEALNGEASLLVIRLDKLTGASGLIKSPVLKSAANQNGAALSGSWQFRAGDDPAWSNMPLPAKFGTGTNIVLPQLSATYIGGSSGISAAELKAKHFWTPPIEHRLVTQGNGKLAIVAADGKIEWEMNWGGIHDIHVLPSGNIMVQQGSSKVAEIDVQKKAVVWSYDSAKSNGNEGRRVEVHAFQPLEDNKVMIAESGAARIIEVDRDGKLLHEVKLKVEHPNPHTDTRLARKLKSGNYLVCHEGDGALREYSPSGAIVWEYRVPLFDKSPKGGHGPEAWGNKSFAAVRLASGNTLLSTGNGHSVLEVTPAGEIVWDLRQNGLKDITLAWVTTLEVLPSGNYLIGNCHAGPGQPLLIEVNPRTKRAVWTFNQFERFGNSLSNTQLLDAPAGTIR